MKLPQQLSGQDLDCCTSPRRILVLMIYITVILKELTIMDKITDNIQKKGWEWPVRITGFLKGEPDNKVTKPFRVLVNKEISDHVRSWRFIILLALIALSCIGSVYTALANINKVVDSGDAENP